MKSLKAKIVSTSLTIAGIATLIGFSVSTLAWYTNNKVGEGDGLDVQINVDSELIYFDFKLYKYDQMTKEGVEYVERQDANFDLNLNKFDNFIRERNVNNNNIIRFHVTFTNYNVVDSEQKRITVNANIDSTKVGDPFDGAFTDSATRTYSDTLGYKYNKTNGDITKEYICNNISNIIYFKGFMYSYIIDGTTYYADDSISIDESTADSTYKTATEAFKNFDENRFITGSSKSTSLRLDLDEINIKAEEAIFYIEYNYDTDLVDTFLNDTEIVGSQDVTMMGSNIEFMKDIKEIIISTEEIK